MTWTESPLEKLCKSCESAGTETRIKVAKVAYGEGTDRLGNLTKHKAEQREDSTLPYGGARLASL